MKLLVFDMDGTIADLYGVENWHGLLVVEDVKPYAIAKPMYDMVVLGELLNALKGFGYRVVVTTWLKRNSSVEYERAVAEVKKTWLDNAEFPYDDFYAVRYGTPKQEVTRGKGEYQILFDDNAEVRKAWDLGSAVDITEVDLIKYLADLIEQEVNNV